MKDLKTLQDAILYFSDEMKCIEAVAIMKWPSGKAVCPDCGGMEHYWLAKQKRWKCRNGKCNRQFSVKIGTIFEESPISLTKWLPAMWLISNCRNGVSSYEVARAVGVTQKSAWFMMHRIRFALKNRSLGGFGQSGKPVEVDETFVGGNFKNMHKDRLLAYNKRGGAHGKAIVMGMLDRHDRQVRAKVIPAATKEVLEKHIDKNLVPVATVYTDQHLGYYGLEAKRYIHETVNHMEEYVRGEVHTQGIENFWSLLKRGLTGTYISVEPYHLERYVDEQAFRFNNRGSKKAPKNDGARFKLALSKVAGKRLTYAKLTGKEGETRPTA